MRWINGKVVGLLVLALLAIYSVRQYNKENQAREKVIAEKNAQFKVVFIFNLFWILSVNPYVANF